MKNNIEIWKPIKGYENNYEISNLGRVKSLARMVSNGRVKKDTILKPVYQSTGYYHVTLFKDKKPKQISIHRIVAINFLGLNTSNSKLVVDHIDNNKLNNSVNNLQLISNRENVTKDIKFAGVNFRKDNKKWTARIVIDGCRKYLGQFQTKEKAILAYNSKLKEINNGWNIRKDKWSNLWLRKRKL